MPAQVLAWLLISGTMTVIWHVFVAGAISMLTRSQTFMDVSDSYTTWNMSFMMFVFSLIIVGVWLWAGESKR
jgi:ABC-type branched-subunit amino acid transport system permease subunit